MNILFHLGHPAHFHLFKNVINKLHRNKHRTSILIKKKDILEDLLNEVDLKYYNILPQGRRNSMFSIALGLLKQDFRLLFFCLKNRPDILIGTSVSIAHVGWFLKIPSLVVNEDDANVVPLFAKLSYPFSTAIVSPDVCNNGKWEYKSIKYRSYHELAYLHPDHFIPNKDVISKYINTSRSYVLIRFASLAAHHDFGIKGIDDKLAMKIIEIIEPHADVYLTSERKFGNNLEKYRLNINPIDMHHVMAFAKMYIGDSQTMAAEAGVLGVPFIRYNDFVDRIGYLSDLENKFELGFGIKPEGEAILINIINSLINKPNLKEDYQEKRKFMLSKKINLSEFLYSLIVKAESKTNNAFKNYIK